MARENMYTRFKAEQAEETNDFCKRYCEWAFGPKQFKALLDKLNLTEEQLKEQYTSFIGGGIIKKDKVEAWHKLCKRQAEELKNKLLNNRSFAYCAFMYEFNNYECGYTGDYSRALAALGLSNKDIIDYSNPDELYRYYKILGAYKKATKVYEKWCDKHIW